MVSIITPSYNSSRFVRATIESIQVQTYQNWELLITDDCSNDGSVSVIREYMEKDSRIKLFIQETNQGPGAARNRSLENATGQYIAFLDSDDVWEPQKLEKQLEFMKEEKAAFVFSAYYLMDEKGIPLNKIVHVPAKIDYAGYLRNTIIGCLTVLIDRKQTGDFRMPLIRTSQDMATWLLIMKRGFKAYGMPEPMAGYRVVGNSNTSKKRKAALDVWKVYRQIEHLSFGYACFNFMGYVRNAIKKRL